MKQSLSPQIYIGVDFDITVALDFDFFDNLTITEIFTLDSINVDIDEQMREHEHEYLQYYLQDMESYDSHSVQCILNTWEMNENSLRYSLKSLIYDLERDLFVS